MQTQLKEKKENVPKNSKRVVTTFAFLAVSEMLAAAQMQMPSSKTTPEKSSATQKTLTETVSDSMCGAHHMAKDNSPAGCASMCVRQGMKYALVVGDKVYKVLSKMRPREQNGTRGTRFHQPVVRQHDRA